MSSGGRLIIANLDCEVEWAGGPALPSHVRALVASAAREMAIVARPGDRLWLPAPQTLELAGVAIESGPLEAIEPAADVLAWGETSRTAALRLAPPSPSPLPSQPAPALDLLWSNHTAPAIARRCNHRRFSFELAHHLGVALPGAAIVTSVADIEALLRAVAHRASRTGEWVVKAPLAAAGRDRVRRRATEIDRDAAIRLGRLFDLHRELVFEPWMERSEDFGCAGIVTALGVSLFPPHRLVNNPNGVFRSIEPLDRELPELSAIARAAGAALADAGYRGPFGIDAYAYRDADGETAFHPLSEINARFTHGLLAALRAGRECR